MNAVELGWAITSYVSIITVMLITGICFSCFVRPYLRRKRAAAYAGGVYFVAMLALYLIPPRLDNFTAYAIGILCDVCHGPQECRTENISCGHILFTPLAVHCHGG